VRGTRAYGPTISLVGGEEETSPVAGKKQKKCARPPHSSTARSPTILGAASRPHVRLFWSSPRRSLRARERGPRSSLLSLCRFDEMRRAHYRTGGLAALRAQAEADDDEDEDESQPPPAEG